MFAALEFRATHARLRLTKTLARPRVFTSFTAYTP
ncbi:hypothetical protein EMIT0P4_30268 [Pseudomonas sp. IT-P4]